MIISSLEASLLKITANIFINFRCQKIIEKDFHIQIKNEISVIKESTHFDFTSFNNHIANKEHQNKQGYL